MHAPSHARPRKRVSAHCAVGVLLGLLGVALPSQAQTPSREFEPEAGPSPHELASPSPRRHDGPLTREEHQRQFDPFASTRPPHAAAGHAVPQPGAPASPCALPPDGRWRVYPMGITLPEVGIFDAPRNRFVYPQPGVPEFQVLDYSVSPARWEFACVEGVGPTRVYLYVPDLANDRVLCVGAITDPIGVVFEYGLWELRLSPRLEWIRLDHGFQTPPHFVFGGGYAALDARRDRLIVYQQWGPTRKLWTLDLANPTEFVPVVVGNPWTEAWWGEQMVLDPIGDRLLLFGGYGVSCHHGCFDWYSAGTWFLSLNEAEPTWRPLWTAGAAPAGRTGAVLAFDTRRNRLLLAGGAGHAAYRDVFELQFGVTATWRLLSQADFAPQGFGYRPGAYDVDRDRLLLYSNHPADEVWAFSPETRNWQALAARQTLRSGGFSTATIFDPRRGRIVQHGGGSSPDMSAGTFWAKPPVDGVVEWGPLPAGPRRADHAGLYDSRRDRLLIFGGYDANGARADVWALPLEGDEQWTKLEVQGDAPLPRATSVAIYDPVGDRLVVHSGSYQNDPAQLQPGETWMLSFDPVPRWTALQSAPVAPSPGGHRRAVYDPDRRRMLMVGPDLWELPLEEFPVWRQLQAAGGPIGTLYHHDAVFDDNRGRVLARAEGDWLWELSFEGTPTWRQLSPQGTNPGAYFDRLAYDPRGDQALIYWSGQLWTLERGRAATPVTIDLVPGNPNDHRGAPASAPLRVELHGSADLDVGLIDAATLRLSGATPLPADAAATRVRIRDVDRDGHMDLSLAFDFEEVREVAARGPLVLRGATTQGGLFRGEASLSLRGRTLEAAEAAEAARPGPVNTPVLHAAFRQGRLVVQLGGAAQGKITLECFDVQGRRLAARAIQKPDALPMELEFPESAEWQAGLTFVRLGFGSHSLTVRSIRL